MSQDNRLLPLPAGDRMLDRPLSEIAQAKPYGVSAMEPTHLRDYFFVILKRKWLILSLVLVVTALVAIQMYRQPNIYQAATTIQIDQKQQSLLQTKEIVINAQNDPAYWNTQLKLLESPALARQVVVTLDLQNNPDFFGGGQAQPGLISSLRRLFSRGSASTPATKPQNTVPVVNGSQPTVPSGTVNVDEYTPEQRAKLEPYEDAIAGGLTVEPVASTNLVALKFTHTNPELAQKIVDAMAAIFVYNNLVRETEGTDKATELLSKQIAELQLKITRQEEEKMNYAINKNLPTSDVQGENVDVAVVGQLSTQLLEAQNARKKAQAEYDAARTAPDPFSVPAVQNDERIRTLREKIELLEQKRNELLVTYTEAWPGVKKIDEQLKPLREALQKAPQEVIVSLRKKYEAALSTENMLQKTYNEKRGVTTQQNKDSIYLNNIKANIETDKQLYNTLLQRQRELQISEPEKPNNVRVTEKSRLPRAPIGPPRMRNILIGLLLALGAGLGLAFLLDYLDDTLKSVEDVDRYIHLPALALIPASRSERVRIKGKAPTGPSEGGEVTALALIDDVRSPVAESYRHLRTSLLLSSAGQPPRSILVTSSQPSEGKTTTAVNTAVMFAQTGAEVLIVDCDLRRPRIHAHFNVPNARGLTNYLAGETDLDSLLQSYEKLPNLKLLTSGPVPPNPAELLGSDEMRKLLNALSERFTHIIIDSPPAISFTDASILSTLVDGVMLVVHGGRSSRAVVRRAKQQLIDVGANIFGIVLNNVKLDTPDYYYYGYGGYYSSYYTSEDDAPDNAAPSGTAR